MPEISRYLTAAILATTNLKKPCFYSLFGTTTTDLISYLIERGYTTLHLRCNRTGHRFDYPRKRWFIPGVPAGWSEHAEAKLSQR